MTVIATTQAGIGTPDWLKTNGVRIALIILLAMTVSRVGTLAIRRMRRRLEGAANATGAVNLRRTTTVVELLNSALRTVIWTVVVLLVLGQMGMDLGPLIAGAGIIGVALGFGAQSMVRDFLNGFFILLENQFTVGDTVELEFEKGTGSVAGRVEALTLRTTSLRGADGALQVIPNGNIYVVTNRSRGQSRVIVEIQLPRGEDLEETRRLLNALCTELRDDPRIARHLFEGPEVLGIHRLTEESVLLRVGAETSPARAEEVKREISWRIERRFVPIPLQVDVASV